MLGNDNQMKALENKLLALVRCVIKQAKTDPEFAEQLQAIILSDSLRSSLQAEEKVVRAKVVFNPVNWLQQHGLSHLLHELEGKPNSELLDIIRFHRIIKGKSVKGLDRPVLIEEIVKYAEKSLNQGGAFLRDFKPGNEAKNEGKAQTDDTPEKNLDTPPTNESTPE